MIRHYKIQLLVLVCLLFTGLTAKAQISFSPDPVCTAGVNVTFTSGLVGSDFDFNSGVIPPGWSTTGGFSVTTEPCAAPSISGTSFYWASTATGTPSIVSNDLDMSGGGLITFDMSYAIQGNPSPCEGPDLSDEGVSLQYSTDGGATWLTIQYWDPMGGAAGAWPFTGAWQSFAIAVPPAAQTCNTRIRWIQLNSSGSAFDNWGIDEIDITTNSCTLDWDFGDGTTVSGVTSPTHTYTTEGTYTITVTYTCGCTSGTETTTITVGDVTPPVITCPSDVSSTTDAGVCTSNVTVGMPTASDDCTLVSVTNDFNGTSDASGTYPLGTTTVTWTATDAAGHTATCQHTVTVADDDGPDITCADITVGTGTAATACEGNITVPAPVAVDACGGVVTLVNNFNSTSDASGTYPVGTTTVIWTATDAFGNSSTCSHDVTVVDETAPVINCPADITVNNDPGTCGAYVCYPLPTATDNCVYTGPIAGFTFLGVNGTTSYYRANTPTNYAAALANCYAAGGHILKVEDAAENAYVHGLQVAQGMTDMWLGMDDVAVEGTWQWADCSVLAWTNWNAGEPNNSGGIEDGATMLASSGLWNDLPTTSSLDYMMEVPSAQVSLVAGLAPKSTFPVGTTMVTYEAEDAAGNTVSCSFNVTVVDAEAPTATTVNITQTADAGVCGAAAGSLALGASTADNCGISTVTNDAPAILPVGTTTVTHTVTDVNGNTTTVTQTVTITDDENPNAVCQDITLLIPFGAASGTITGAQVDGGSTDNCGVVTQDVAPDTFTPAEVGDNTVTLTVYDAAGNSSTCTATVTVVVGPPPPPNPAPPCFYAVGTGVNEIKLTWCDVGDYETGYEIWRLDEVSGNYYRIAEIGPQDGPEIIYYDNSDLQPDTEYTYFITAMRGIRRSHPSDTDLGITWPLPGEVELDGYACMGSKALLVATGTHESGKFYWYRDANLTDPVEEAPGMKYAAPTLETEILTESVTYWLTSVGQRYESDTFSITIEPNALPTAVIIGEEIQRSCDGSHILEAEAYEGAAYRWYRNGSAIELTTEPFYTTFTDGEYSVEVIRLGCSAESDKVLVDIGFTPTARIMNGLSQRFCESGMLTADEHTGVLYQWFRDGTLVGEGSSLEVSEDGEYTLVAEQYGCSSDYTTSVSVSSFPTSLDIASDQETLCADEQAVLTAPALEGATYEWFRNGRRVSGLQASELRTGLPGTYTVFVTLDGACTRESAGFELNRYEAPETEVIRLENNISLETISGEYSNVEWFLNNEAMSSLSGQTNFEPTAEGVYFAELTYGNGCTVRTNSLRFFGVLSAEDDAREEEVMTTTILYPNPTEGELFIRFSSELKGQIKVMLHDNLGRALQEHIYDLSKSREVSLDLSRYSAGQYTVSMFYRGGRITKKIIRTE